MHYIIILFTVSIASCVELDLIDCGIDHDLEVQEGNVELTKYPWLGILYYTYYGDGGESRAVTTVALIQKEFVIAAAADIGPMPKINFRASSRVLLGEGWRAGAGGRRVRNYVLHPEYGETYNTVALVQLRDPVRDKKIAPLCPPPERLRNPVFYVMKFNEDYNTLQKQVVPMSYVPANLCKEFYVRANLYSKKMRPPHAACGVSLAEEQPCVWAAGAALVARDVWGRWQLLGLGVRGPGCGAPSRYLDIMSYDPWIRSSLSKFQRITISKISSQKYILRSGSNAYQKFGACDPEEKVNLVYRDFVQLRTDNNQYQFLTYNMTIRDNVEFTCLTLELINASAVSEMRVKHFCPRESHGTPCHTYRSSLFEISVYLMFSDTCIFEMFAWGHKKNMTLLDIQEWKWEEGTYYEDFSLTRTDYRGQTFMTEFGYEPLEEKIWVPEYDIWTTTEFDNSSWSSTTALPNFSGDGDEFKGYQYIPTQPPPPTTTTTTSTEPPRTKRTFKRKTTTTTTTSIPFSSPTTPSTI